jgi:integration host factor subunit alpha
MTLTKAKLVDRLYDKGLGLTKRDLRLILDDVLETMVECFDNSEKVKLSGFGNFSVQNKTARIGRNPYTEEEIVISRRRILNFKASPRLHVALNDSSENDND